MEESGQERVERASLRRRPGGFSYESAAGPIPREKANRSFFYIAGGSLIFALVAFVCGVQMGKSLTEAPVTGAAVSALRENKSSAPPFRIMEKGKGGQSGQESVGRGAAPAESVKEKAGASPQPLPIPGPVSASAAPPEKAPAPPEEEKPRPVKAKYSIQVAALNNPAEAQDLVNQLKKKGYEAYQVTGTAAAKGTLHRVRIGQFQTLQEARQFALAFEKKENRKPIIASLQNP